MSAGDKSLFDKAYDPILQAALALCGTIVFTLVAMLVRLTGLLWVSERFAWMSSAAFVLLFAVFNSVFALAAKDTLKYWGRSIYSFLGLAVLSGLAAYFLSSIPLADAGSYRWIYVVLTFGYLVFLSMMTFMKKIVEFAQREEWNHPRIRQKRRK